VRKLHKIADKMFRNHFRRN